VLLRVIALLDKHAVHDAVWRAQLTIAVAAVSVPDLARSLHEQTVALAVAPEVCAARSCCRGKIF
jgi:hypothetical protein